MTPTPAEVRARLDADGEPTPADVLALLQSESADDRREGLRLYMLRPSRYDAAFDGPEAYEHARASHERIQAQREAEHLARYTRTSPEPGSEEAVEEVERQRLELAAADVRRARRAEEEFNASPPMLTLRALERIEVTLAKILDALERGRT